MQRIRFDRIDFPFRPPVGDQFARNAESETTQQRYGDRDNGIEADQPRQPHARIQVKEQPVQGVDASPHGGDDQTGNRSNKRREHERLDSRARTMARSRRGISSLLITLSITGSPTRESSRRISWNCGV